MTAISFDRPSPTHARPRPSLAGRARTTLTAALIGLIVAVGPARAQPHELGASLRSLLDHARQQSPELASMRHEAAAALQRVLPAGALPDPVLRVELENINNYGNDASPSLLPSKVGETKYTLMQSFPLWGKRDLRRDAASADAQQADARASAAWTELAARLKSSYAQYYLAAGNERLTLEVVDLLSRLEQVAQARYAGGLVAQQDAIRAQLEQTAMRAELNAIERDKRQARARINAMLARDVSAPLAEPQALPAVPMVSVVDAQSLVERARRINPLLVAEQARLRVTELGRELTLRNRYPDVQFGISPTQMGSRITTWGLMVEMNIPLQQESRRAQESEAESMVSAQRARAEATASRLLGELGENLSALDIARRNEALVTTQMLPQSELALRSALAAYENGKVDFATLLEAQRLIRKARLDLLMAQVEARLRVAEIERIVGEDL